MNIYWKLCLPVLLLGATALPALAAQSAPDTKIDARTAQYDQWQTDAVTTLAMRDDADSLFTAALYDLSPVLRANNTMHTRKHAKQHALDLLDQAAALEPNAADIAAQALMTCSEIVGCDVSTYADRYSTAAPNDALAWLPALQIAVKQADQTEITRIVQRMGAADTFHSYRVASGERAERAMSHVPTQPDFGELNRVVGGDQQLITDVTQSARSVSARMLASMATMLPYEPITKACKPTAAAFPERRQACRHIGLMLEHGGSAMGNQVGLLLHRQAADSDADHARALATGRRLDWQSRLYYSKLAYDNSDTPRGAMPTVTELRKIIAISKQHTAAIRKYHGEAAGIQALLANAGLPLNPPANWVDKQQQIRLTEDARYLKANASQSCKK